MRKWLLPGCAAGVLLTGCGQKGPLYLPDKGAAAVTSAPAAGTQPPAAAPDTAPPAKKPTDKDDDPKSPQ